MGERKWARAHLVWGTVDDMLLESLIAYCPCVPILNAVFTISLSSPSLIEYYSSVHLHHLPPQLPKQATFSA